MAMGSASMSMLLRLSRSLRCNLSSELPSFRRLLSTASASPPLSDAFSVPPAIYISESHDPFFNLAFEEWIFRKTDPSSLVLYLYRNSASVIIGRNQNPWKEINLTKLRELNIPFVRRKSGGGTVYHDLGNTNYCVFVPRQQFERRTNAALVARALESLGIPAYVNERNDICVDGFKVSGSAFKLVNVRAYHHGTMLINAKLGDLQGVLGNNRDAMVTKGVASVSSPVRNLRHWSASIDHDSFVAAVVNQFKAQYGGSHPVKLVNESELATNEYARNVMEELKSWDYMYGQSPEFSYELSREFDAGPVALTITSRHALVTSALVTSNPAAGQEEWSQSVQELANAIVGDRYGSLERLTAYAEDVKGVRGEHLKVLVEWLKGAM